MIDTRMVRANYSINVTSQATVIKFKIVSIT